MHAVSWAIFGFLGMPIAFAGILALNPFPRDIPGALIRTLFIPVTSGIWWWYLEGTLLEYFVTVLVCEFIAIYLSLFLMSFIPLKVYDPQNPNAGDPAAYLKILVFQGFMASGGFMLALVIAILPWARDVQYWQRPFTYILLLISALQYINSNFHWHKSNSDRWDGDGKEPKPVRFDVISIEPVLLLVAIPWLISFIFINK